MIRRVLGGRAATRLKAALVATALGVAGLLAPGAAPALAHEGHPLNPLARTTSVIVAEENGARVDLRIAFEIANPTEAAFTIVSAEARGGAETALVPGDGEELEQALRVDVGPDATVAVAPPFGVLVVRGALRRALEGAVGMLVTLNTEDGAGLNMLVRLPATQ